MTSKYDRLKPAPLAPLYYYDGRDRLNLDGSHDCRPFPQPAAQNWDLIKDQGTVQTIAYDGRILSPEEIQAELRRRITSSLLENASSADLLFFNPIELLVISADGDLLLTLRSHRGASIGMCDHFSGGFPKCVGEPPKPEPREKTALREAEEELDIDLSSERIINLNTRSCDNEITPYVLGVTEGDPMPGVVPEIIDRFSLQSRYTTEEILRMSVPKSDSIGMVIIKAGTLQMLANDGHPVVVEFVPSTAAFAQPFIEQAEAEASPVSLSRMRELLNAAPPMTREERAQKGHYDLDRRVAAQLSVDVMRRATIASGLQAFQEAGISLVSTIQAYIDDFRKDAQKEIIQPRLLEEHRPPLQSIPALRGH